MASTLKPSQLASARSMQSLPSSTGMNCSTRSRLFHEDGVPPAGYSDRIGRVDPEYGLGRRGGRRPSRSPTGIEHCLRSDSAPPPRCQTFVGGQSRGRSCEDRDAEYGLGRIGRPTIQKSKGAALGIQHDSSKHQVFQTDEQLTNRTSEIPQTDRSCKTVQSGTASEASDAQLTWRTSSESQFTWRTSSEPPRRHWRQPGADGNRGRKTLQWAGPTPRSTRSTRAEVLRNGMKSSIFEFPESPKKPPLPPKTRMVDASSDAGRLGASQESAFLVERGRGTPRMPDSPHSLLRVPGAYSGRTSPGRTLSRTSSARSMRSARSKSPGDPLGLRWDGTDEGGWEDNAPALWKGGYQKSHQQSPRQSSLQSSRQSPRQSPGTRRGHGRDGFQDGDLPSCIGRGKRHIDHMDHFTNSGTATEDVDSHGHSRGDSFEGGMLRGIGRGRRSFGKTGGADHFTNSGVALGDDGLHGHERGNTYVDGIQWGIGNGKRHIPLAEHFEAVGAPKTAPVLSEGKRVDGKGNSGDGMRSTLVGEVSNSVVDVHDLPKRQSVDCRTAPSDLWMRWQGSAAWVREDRPLHSESTFQCSQEQPQAAGLGSTARFESRHGSTHRFDCPPKNREGNLSWRGAPVAA